MIGDPIVTCVSQTPASVFTDTSEIHVIDGNVTSGITVVVIVVVLDLVYENFLKYKNLIFFMGKSGKKIFEKSKNDWDLEYIEKKSLTNKDSFLLNIKKITKKNKNKYKKIKCKSFQ